MSNDLGASASQTGLSPTAEPLRVSSADAASIPRAGDLRVWWIPQVPMKAFEVPVSGLAEASLLLDTLGRYDAFQFENRVKPDYCNAGGLVEFDGADWCDWCCDESGDDFDAVRDDPERLASAIEARRAATGTGAVHESAVGDSRDAHTDTQP